MSAQKATSKTINPETPLERLSNTLSTDMNAVNDVILSQMHSGIPLIPEVAGYLIASGGKRLRPLLTLAATNLYGGDMARAHNLATAVEFIHTATLLHDDVIDESKMRRGKETANLVFGNQASILVGDFLFARAFQLMTADNNLRILKTLSGASVIITEGEVHQLSMAGTLHDDMEKYLAIIKAKTAALFASACEVGPLIADRDNEHTTALYDYGLNLGIAFQIADDALDYMADEETLGKVVGDDFREGKVTAPIILALKHASTEEHAFLKEIIEGDDFTDSDLKRAQDMLHKHNAIEASLKLAQDYAHNAQNSLKIVPNGEIKSMLIEIADYVVKRDT